MAKPFTLPPGVDARRVRVMRRALSAVHRDAAFLADAEMLRLRFQLCRREGGAASAAFRQPRARKPRSFLSSRTIPRRRRAAPTSARTKRSDEPGHIGMPRQPPEAFDGFEHARGDPAQHHLPSAPALHIPLHVASTTQQTLGGVLGRAFPQSQRVCLAIRRDPERHREAVLPDVHAVEDQRDEVEAVERGGLPRPQLRRRLGHEPPADAALARPPTHDSGRDRLQAPRVLAGRHAHQHLVDDAPIQRVRVRQGLECRQRDFPPVGAHARPLHGHLASAQHHFAGHRARAGLGTLGLMRVSGTAERRAVLLQHRVEHAEARADHQLEEFRFRVDQEFTERQGPDSGRFNSNDRTGYATSSWRLLVGRASARG